MQSLSIHQKRLILDERDERKREGLKVTQVALAAWAKENLGLQSLPDQSTMSRLLKNAEKIRSMSDTHNTSVKKKRRAAAPRLEDALYKWMCTQSSRGIMINADLVKMEGRKLMNAANELLPECEQIFLKFSKGWIERFKKRFGLRFRQVHGEAMSVDIDKLAEEMPRLERIISTFAERDTWNADEFGLFYRQPPGWTLSRKVLSGHKKDKTRISVLAACNADGSENMPLMFIGSAAKPRSFKKKSAADLGLDYHANRKAWMNKILFYEWLHRLDRYIGKEEGRKILLLIDNCSAHGKQETLPVLQNVRVEYLPPNTTSKVQPLDAGVIAWVKRKYKRRLLLRVFDNIDMGRKSIYNVDILTAIRWTGEEWENCPPRVIRNCFLHCFKKQDICEKERGDDREDVLNRMESDAEEHNVAYTRAGLENLLHPDGEDDIEENVGVEELRYEVAGVDIVTQSSDGEESVEVDDSMMTTAQELECLAIARSILERHGVLGEEGRKAFGTSQRLLREEKRASMVQTKISDHFSTK